MKHPAMIVGAIAASIAALQPWLLLILGEPVVSTLATLSSAPALANRIFWLMLICIPAMAVAYGIAGLRASHPNGVLGAFTLFAFAVWFSLELLPRSFDLWIVAKRWLPAFIAGSADTQAQLEQHYRLYRDGLFALVFVRRHMLLLAQLGLGVLVWSRGRSWRLLSLALGLSVLRLLLGSMASYGGFEGLDRIADPLYFVTSGLVFPLLAWNLYRESRMSDPRPAEPSPGI